jgi:hypothetical protein
MTETNCEGDRFTARVIEPSEYEGAVIRGHVAKIERSGRMTGRTEMALDFDSITLRNGRSGAFHAQIESDGSAAIIARCSALTDASDSSPA